eukprot:gene3703-53426_t
MLLSVVLAQAVGAVGDAEWGCDWAAVPAPSTLRTLTYDGALPPPRPYAMVHTAGVETVLGAAAACGGGLAEWAPAPPPASTDTRSAAVEHYSLPCPDGSLAGASVAEYADPVRGGWVRRVRLTRVCPGGWTHLQVNVAPPIA